MRVRGFLLGLIVLSGAILTGSSGCSRAPSAASSATTAPAVPSPKETLARLLAARRNQEYSQMTPLIAPPHAQDVIETLLAVDDFLSANRALCEYVRNEIALGLADTIDHSAWGANLEIFSQYVELLDEKAGTDEAVVSFLMDGRLPAKQAKLRRIDGAWRYDPGAGYSPQLPAAFHKMARGLRQTLEDLQSGRLSARDVRDDPRRLLDEIQVRLLPGIKLLPAPPDNSKPAGGG